MNSHLAFLISQRSNQARLEASDAKRRRKAEKRQRDAVMQTSRKDITDPYLEIALDVANRHRTIDDLWAQAEREILGDRS